MSRNDIQLDYQNDDGNTFLHIIASDCYMDLPKEILQNSKIDINVKNKLSSTPLFEAILKNNQQYFNILIDHKDIDVNVINNAGFKEKILFIETPLIVAYKKEFTNFVKALLKKDRIDLNIATKKIMHYIF